jgi:hypothetical protein
MKRRLYQYIAIGVVGTTAAAGCNSDIYSKDSESIGSISQRDTSDINFVVTQTEIIGIAKTVGSAFSAIGGVVSAAMTIGQALGIIDNPQKDIITDLQNLSTQLDQVASEITWFEQETDRETALSNLKSDIDTVSDELNSNVTPDWATLDVSEGRIVAAGANQTAFEHLYNDSLTNGTVLSDPVVGSVTWKSLIPYTTSDLMLTNGFVYDWRLETPAFLNLVARRMTLMAMEDGKFTADRRFHDELTEYNGFLQSQLTILNGGLRCNVQEQMPASGDESGNGAYPNYRFWVSCADIFSGLNETQILPVGSGYPLDPYYCCSTDEDGTTTCDSTCQAQETRDYNTFYANSIQSQEDQDFYTVREETPFFGVQSLLDDTYLYANGVTDLTKGDPAIHLASSPSLCLSAPSGAGSVVLLQTCSTGAASQTWSYNRETQQLIQPSSNLCLDAQAALPKATGAILSSCNGAVSQQWSWDPKDKVLYNGLGNVLEVLNNNPPISGGSVETNVRTGGSAQQWVQKIQYEVATNARFSWASRVCPSCTAHVAGLAVGSNGAVFSRAFDNGLYSDPVAVTATGFAPTDARVAIGQQTTNQADGFLVGNDGKVYMTAETGTGAWQAPVALTASNFASPGANLVTATNAGQLGVFLVDRVGKLQAIWWNSLLGWLGPVALTPANYAPAGAALAMGTRSNGELDAYAVGGDGSLKYLAFNGIAWSGPTSLTVSGFAPPGAPVTAALDVNGFMNVMTVGNDGAIYTKWDLTPLWTGPTALTTAGFAPLGADVEAINFSKKSLDAFVVDTTGAVEVLANPGTGWTTSAISAPSVATPGGVTSPALEGTGQLDVFAGASIGGFLEAVNTGSTWSSFSDVE